MASHYQSSRIGFGAKALGTSNATSAWPLLLGTPALTPFPLHGIRRFAYKNCIPIPHRLALYVNYRYHASIGCRAHRVRARIELAKCWSSDELAHLPRIRAVGLKTCVGEITVHVLLNIKAAAIRAHKKEKKRRLHWRLPTNSQQCKRQVWGEAAKWFNAKEGSRTPTPFGTRS